MLDKKLELLLAQGADIYKSNNRGDNSLNIASKRINEFKESDSRRLLYQKIIAKDEEFKEVVRLKENLNEFLLGSHEKSSNNFPRYQGDLMHNSDLINI